MTAISIDGKLVAEREAAISVLDRGFLYGDGLFEVLRTWDGIAVDVDAHLDRLLASARALELKTVERAALTDALVRTLAAAQAMGPTSDVIRTEPREYRMRIVITRGPGAIGARLADLGVGRTIVIVEALPAQPTALALAVVDWPLPQRLRAGHKTLAYIDHIIARELAAVAGADEAVRLDAAGFVVEGATSNVFIARAGRIATPPIDSGALPGITRGRVLDCCARLGIPAAIEPIALDRLRAADEIFVTSALRGVVAATRLDGDPRPAGPLSARLASAYVDMMRRHSPRGA